LWFFFSDNSLNDSLPLRPIRNITSNPRRYRSSFNTEQIEILEQTFCHTPYPDVTTRERLSQHLNIDENRIQVCCICKYSLYDSVFSLSINRFGSAIVVLVLVNRLHHIHLVFHRQTL
jgi:hypothetical protein